VRSIIPIAILFLSGAAAAQEKTTMPFTIKSQAFESSSAIPVRHTCDGEDVSPALSWTQPPPGTKAFALIVDDPDAPVGDWVHWLVFDLPATTLSLTEKMPADGDLKTPEGAKQGRNDFGRLGWGGPCPPPGKPHRYFFKLYALDAPIGLAAGASKSAIERAMQAHILGKAEMFGTYARRR
jgi:hypothetical protein